jgi:murein DD-endopeptidase MepM/ murein hydrolase activator NlpD
MLFRGIPATIAVTACVAAAAMVLIASRPLRDAPGQPENAAVAADRLLALDPGPLTRPPSTLQVRGPDMPVAETRGFAVQPIRYQTVRVERGDTFAGVLNRLGIGGDESSAAVAALKKHFNPRRIRAGQEIAITVEPLGNAEGSIQLLGLTFESDPLHEVSLIRAPDGTFDASRETMATRNDVAAAGGTINSSLFLAGRKAGVPASVIAKMIRAYSWDVDFQRDIQPGDRFEVMYERSVNDRGRVVRGGDLVYASLTLGGRRHAVYRFTTAGGKTDFYTEKGQSIRKALLRTPVDGARLSSGFGRRKHPILGYNKMHRGLDFAAPQGTPIFAAGDGVVKFAGRKGGYGNYVRIEHNGTYSTAYAHMHRIAKGARPGQRVKQGEKIGYVGSTGRSTGPHLHYEIIKNGTQINPLSVKTLDTPQLVGRDLDRFHAHIAETGREFAALSDAPDITVAAESH